MDECQLLELSVAQASGCSERMVVSSEAEQMTAVERSLVLRPAESGEIKITLLGRFASSNSFSQSSSPNMLSH